MGRTKTGRWGSIAQAFWFALVFDVGSSSGEAHAEGSAPLASAPLEGGAFSNPFPGGVLAGYAGDTGLDIAGKYLPVFAVRDGFVDYAERGHTVWTKAPDTPLSVRIEFDEPVPWNGKGITHAYYTHMSRLAFEQSADTAKSRRRHVKAGELLGISGIGNGMPHLHLGLLLNGNVEQDRWDDLVLPLHVAKLLGRRNGTRLPSR